MRVAAQHVLSGDRIRGIGLVVEFSEPHSDYLTSLVGKVSTAPDPAAGYDPDGERQLTDVQVVLPNNHRVNVVRADANFRLDRIRWTQEAIDAMHASEGEDVDGFVGRLVRIANAPRGRHLSAAVVRSYVVDSYEGGANTSAEQIVSDLDAIEEFDGWGEPVVSFD